MSRKKLGGLRIGVGIGLFLAFQYASSLWQLASRTGGMDSKFSQVAVDDYRGFLISQNLFVLMAYVIVGLVAWVVLVPLLSSLASRWSTHRPWKTVGVSVIACAFLHGYFMFRLVDTRPYFTSDAAFGSWYYAILDLPPESWRPAIHLLLFKLPIWAGLLVVVWWWWRYFGRRGRSITGALAGLVLLGATWVGVSDFLGQSEGTGDSGSERPMNVIIIGSDSLRGDKLGYAGYRPERSDGAAAEGVSPNIDRWSEDASVFEICRTPLGSTFESGISVMTSTYPHTHGIQQMFPTLGELDEMRERTIPIAELASANGFDTASVGDWCAGFFELTPLGFEKVSVSSFDNFQIYMSQVVLMAHFIVPLYFDNELGYRLFPQIRSFAQFVTPEVVTRRVERMLEKQAGSEEPFFWNVFYSCNHLPYRSSEPYNRLFSDPDYKGPNATGVDFDIDGFIGGTVLEDKWSALPLEEAEQIRALYDGCTRQFDDCFQRLLDALDRHGLRENTIIVLTADHGDDLYEEGVTLGHGLSFQGADASYHVPLVIQVPGHRPQRFEEPVRIIDIAPTLADLLKIDKPDGWEGQSLEPWLRNEGKAVALPFYGETQFPFIQFRVEGIERPKLPPMDGLTMIDPDFNHQFVMRPEFRIPVVEAKQRCLRTADWKLVCTPTAEGTRHYQLFHTASDPDSLTDLASARPDVVEPMRVALERWIDEKRETLIDGIFPDGEPELSR